MVSDIIAKGMANNAQVTANNALLLAQWNYHQELNVNPNLLTLNQITCSQIGSSTDGFSVTGNATVTSSTDKSFLGTKSIKCVTTTGGGSGKGLILSQTVTANTTYTFSGILYSTNFTGNLYFDDSSWATIQQLSVVSDGNWHYFTLTALNPIGNTTIKLAFLNTVEQNATFYLGQLSLKVGAY